MFNILSKHFFSKKRYMIACARASEGLYFHHSSRRGCTMMHEPCQFLTVPEAARLLGAPIGTVWRFCRTGQLPATKVGRSYRIPASAFADLEARARAEATAAQERERGTPA